MANDSEAGGPSSPDGHRTVPHTADLRLEAWSASLEGCIAEAVRGLVDSFADLSAAAVFVERECEISAGTDAGLVVAALNEVIFRVDSDGELPVRTHVEPLRTRVGRRAAVLRFAMAPVRDAGLVGAVPKGVSLHELRVWQNRRGTWTCQVTVDV